MVADLNDVPIRDVNGTVVFVRDVANVHDGSSPQTNLVRVNGRHAVLMSVLKTGSASTLQIVESIKRLLPGIQAQLPQDLKLTAIADQSHLRARRGQQRDPRGRDRGRADRSHDPAVPGFAGAAR